MAENNEELKMINHLLDVEKDLPGPLLLTNNTESVMNSVATYLNGRLEENAQVYICGGEGVIPKAMEEKLAPHPIKRYAGKNRYYTNLEIFKDVEIGKAIAVCSGQSFPDALCASTLQIPILLVGKTLLPDQARFLSEMAAYYGKMERVFYIMGGSAAVSNEVENELKKRHKSEQRPEG